MAALDFTDGFTAAEALQMVRAVLNEPTASYWTADEINKWIQEAVMDITTKTLCYEKSDDITLAATTRVYGTIGSSDSVDDVLKIYGCIFNSGATPPVYRGLTKIHPRMINRLPEQTVGEPFYYYQFGDELGFFPLTSAGVVSAGGKVRVFYSFPDETITNLPYYYQVPSILYAVSRARAKQRMVQEADQFYMMYLNSIGFYRADLYERGVDSKDMFEIPDRAVSLGQG